MCVCDGNDVGWSGDYFNHYFFFNCRSGRAYRRRRSMNCHPLLKKETEGGDRTFIHGALNILFRFSVHWKLVKIRHSGFTHNICAVLLLNRVLPFFFLSWMSLKSVRRERNIFLSAMSFQVGGDHYSTQISFRYYLWITMAFLGKDSRMISCYLLYSLEFRVRFLLGWLPTKAIYPAI